jgi:hypothetical protein
MNLANYQIITIQNSDLIQIYELLRPDLNLRRPVVLDLSLLNRDEQRDVVGIIENWYSAHKASWIFPYPVYIICELEQAVAQIPIFKSTKQLPKFFKIKDNRITSKESHLVGRNEILQQEIKNVEPQETILNLKDYAEAHKRIWSLAQEEYFYRQLLNKLTKEAQHG